MAKKNDGIEILEQETVFQGYFQMDRYRLKHRLHEGGTSPELVREVLERGHVAAVVPFDPLRNEIVLLEQFRPGAMAAGWEPWLIEIVAGVVEEGETAEEMARRETLEEAGCKASDLYHLGRYLSSPGCTSETVEVFCARVDTTNASGVHGLPNEGEDILVKAFSVDEAFALLDEGKILNSMTIIGLQWFRTHQQTIEEHWA